MKTSFVIDGQDAKERIDIVLSRLLEDYTRSSIQRLIEEKSVRVNGVDIIVKKHKLKEGDLVEITFPDPVPLEILPEDMEIDIVYEDEDLIVINKAKGVVVHPGPGNMTGTIVNGIIHHCQGRLSSINGVIRPGIVHRIDKDTGGLMVVAKNDLAHQGLAEQFAARTIKRVYRAIVYNNFPEEEGTIDAAIGRDPKNRLRMSVVGKNGKEARTHYKVLERFGKFTYIEATLETGRTHQIRVHMASINHPLLGDSLYGPKKSGSPVGKGQMLHAKALGFKHPRTGEYMEFDSELPHEFQMALEKLRNLP